MSHPKEDLPQFVDGELMVGRCCSTYNESDGRLVMNEHGNG